jgi:hypothetical protein
MPTRMQRGQGLLLATSAISIVAVVTARAVAAAARQRSDAPATATRGYRPSPLGRAYGMAAQAVDRVIGWDRLPWPLGVPTIIGLRVTLRQKNLHDTSSLPAVNTPPVETFNSGHLVRRTASGEWNDLDDPAMGRAGARFGRNVPLDRLAHESDTTVVSSPSPREVSRALLTRTEFTPATSVNSLVAAWLQFMIRDWISHGRSPTENPWVIPLQPDDPWPGGEMRVMRTPPDPTRPDPEPPGMAATHVNVLTHWWDGSQIYGMNADEQGQIRTGVDGKLHLLANGLVPLAGNPIRDLTRETGFWLGTLMMQTLFTREHNAICDQLKAEYPSWRDDELFERARLINAALIAKIHTVEWTPAVISHPTTKLAIRANWWGVLGEAFHRKFGRVSRNEVINGIPGSATNHFGVPYSITEEFVAVYRMHPLIRDDWPFRAHADNTPIEDCEFPQLSGPNAVDVADRIAMTDVIYSFGTLPPGLVTLHNFPRFLQHFERPDGHVQDLATTDILRSRELRVPRYNEFRRLMHLKPARDFKNLTPNAEWAEEIRRLYDDDIEKVDLTVGMYAERLPKGFAFSDTAFRVFILMASRRLTSDRFLTTYYTSAVYTPAGMKWIEDNTMITVLLRHYPELRPALVSVDNAFAPWRITGR